MLIRVIDFETLGFLPTKMVEAGWVDIDTETMQASLPQSMLVNPGEPIPLEAMAIHHITDDMVKDAPDESVARAALDEGADVYCAHNAAFERGIFTGNRPEGDPRGDRPWICTYRCALHIYPDLASHSNQFVRYYLGLCLGDERANNSHRAGPDAWVTAHILLAMLKAHSVEQLITLSRKKAVLSKVRFGKHQGQLWKDVPRDYLEWIVNKSNMDDVDVVYTAQYYLANKGG